MPDAARAEAERLREGYVARARALVLLLVVGLVLAVVLALALAPEATAAVAVGALALGVGAALLVARHLELLVLARERALLEAAHRLERPTTSPPGEPPSGSLEVAYDAILEIVRRIAADRDRFESAMNGIDAGVIAVDAQDRVTVANPALHDLFPFAEDPLGRDYKELVPSAIEDCVVAARDGRTARLEFEPPGEERRQYVAYAAPRDLGGGVAVVIRDITSIRLLERVRRDFVANVSHELRTPVSVIQASAETLLSGALDDRAAGRKFAEAIERHASRMSRIISGLLDLARLEAGQRGLSREAVNVRASVVRAIDLASAAAEAKGLALDNRVGEAVHVLADPKGVDQVLSNLLENAVKYSDEPGDVIVEAAERQGWVRVAVADVGPGIPDKHRTRVFERFYRVDKGRSRDHGGSGLGLAIVKHLVSAMGGTVGVDPREPRGSVFWVRLPVGVEPPPEVDPAAEARDAG